MAPGAAQAIDPASSRSYQELTFPVSFTTPPRAATLIVKGCNHDLSNATKILSLMLDAFGCGLMAISLETPITPPKPANIVGGGFLLEVPIDLSGQSDPTFFDLHFHSPAWNRGVPFQSVDSGGSNFFVAVLCAGRQADLDFLGDGLNVIDPSRSLLGREFFREIFYVAHERYNPIFRGNPDMSGVHTRLPLQFVEHGLFQLLVIRHGFLLHQHRKLCRGI